MALPRRHVRARRRPGRARPRRLAGLLGLATLSVSLLAFPLGSAFALASAPHPPRQAASRQATTRQAPGGQLLALGDSLAAGYQPVYGHELPPTDPASGLPDQGYPGGYAADLAARLHLRLVDLACPGETTASFSGTPARKACQALYVRGFAARSQLTAALAYLAAHKGAVSLLTIDLGANNVDGCLSATGVNLACVEHGMATAGRQLRPLLVRLKAALRADDPGARMVGMTYYDPFLGLAFDPGGARGLSGAALSVAGVGAFNGVLARDYHAVGFLVADVAGAFATGSILPLTTFRGTRLSRDAARICQLTWMCPAPGSHVPQDIHPKRAGYARIATAFQAALRA